jgi:predicted ATP-binding protein involved in virulence
MLDGEKRTKEFKDMIDSLGEKEKSLAERQAIVAEEIAKREKMEERLKAAMQHNAQDGAGEGNQKMFSKQMRDYAANHGELERLRSLQKSFEKDSDGRLRTSMAGADALARIGGDATGTSSDWSVIARNTKEQIDILKSIDAKTGKGDGETWQ